MRWQLVTKPGNNRGQLVIQQGVALVHGMTGFGKVVLISNAHFTGLDQLFIDQAYQLQADLSELIQLAAFRYPSHLV